MKKIKIIDLLNMIAEGKKVPKKIKWGEHYLEWFVYEYKALKELGQPMLSELVGYGARGINDTVEIIEEGDKRIEKDLHPYGSCADEDLYNGLVKKIYEIIDRINNMEE